MRERSQWTRCVGGRGMIAIAATLIAGCASMDERGATANLPPPPLQLVSAGELKIANDCQVRDGTVYRTNFVVDRDGRVTDIQPEPAPACLQTALTAWLHTARYAPPGTPVTTAIDWMGVSARRIR